MNVYTLSGKAIVLKEPAMASGGEGAVYEIVGYPKKVAKIYHDIADARSRESKITEMVKISKTSSFRQTKIEQDVAWPLSPLFDANHTFIGFGMNRISAKNELDDLYAYPPKRNITVTVENKIHCAISLCDIVQRLHKLGQVFGDGNPVNLKIGDDFSACFLDADSFHFNSGGTVFKCEVCAPGYVAPELIKACKGSTYAAYHGQTFTKETDNFSLAIHIFRLLFNGAHPYICQRQLKRVGSAPAPKSTDKRVENGETPFFKSIPNYTTPSYAPSIHSVPPYIRKLFERAFVDGHTSPAQRPSASEWKAALIKLKGEIKQCAHDGSHYYWTGNKTCPYCEADKNYRSKMNKTIVAASSGNNAAPVHKTKNTATSAAPVYTPNPINYNAQKRVSFAFWSVTIILSLLMLTALGHYVLPDLYDALTGNHTIMMIGVIGSCIAGFIGTLVYNSCWAGGRYSGRHKWYEYILSLLTALGFVVGFGLAMVVMGICLSILFYVLKIVLVIAIIVGICSGG